MINVLFVCTGNICRSPTAEGIFRKIVEQQGLREEFFIDSAGTHDYHVGEAPDKRSQIVAKRNGTDISSLTARQITDEDFTKFEYILVMDHYNMECLKSVCPKSLHKKITLFLTYLDNNIISDEVPDPYYGEGDGFQYVYELILEAATSFLAFVKEKHKLAA